MKSRARISRKRRLAQGSAVEGNRLRAETAEGRKNDKTAMDLMRSLHEQGYTIPEIVQLVANHIDDTLFAEIFHRLRAQQHAPELQPYVETGVAAIIKAGAWTPLAPISFWGRQVV